MKAVYTLADLRDWARATEGEPSPVRLAVVGDPVAHSASPAMHNAALEHCGIAARYVRLHLRAEELREGLSMIAGVGFVGVNCTIPHKAAALLAMDRVDEHAKRVGVVNTVMVEPGGTLAGFNTDGPGLVRAVDAEFGARLGDLRVMVLGAGGGAGRAIAIQCALEGCRRVVLVNRTAEKARDLAGELSGLWRGTGAPAHRDRVSAVEWEREALGRELREVDLVINCTSLGMGAGDSSPLPAAILHSGLILYDTIYTASRTQLMLAGDAVGARSANGFSMLLYQGALAFEIWFGRPAPVELMREALKVQARASR